MTLTEATARNLARKATVIDHVRRHNGVPMFSWIDLSITELCNRACSFCPRADAAFYPNQNLNMPVPLVTRIGDELRALDYDGAVVLCGFGEPLLHPRIVDVVSALHDLRVEIVTNGDRLTVDLIRALCDAGAAYFVVSLYDGPEQAAPFRALFAEAGYADRFILRDRWYDAEKDYGLKLTNRAGTVKVGNQGPMPADARCHYLAYSVSVDWNGDVLLCVQDWQKRVKLGNVGFQSLWEIWTGPAARKHRARLIAGRRDIAPCNACNSDGKLHGSAHAEAWAERRA